MFNKGNIEFDPMVERFYKEWQNDCIKNRSISHVKEFFQKIFENGYREGYNDGQADAVDYEYHGSFAKERCRY